ncbi:PilZ domain-containing protein [Methylobacterium sp. CM6257]
MDNKRETIRRRVLLAGKVLLPGGGVIDCTLRDRSESGARIKVQSVIGIPDEFRLLVEPTGETVQAKVAWRRPNEIGVRIL